MANMDIFNDDAFSMIEMTAAVNKIPRLPSLIGDMGLFTPKPISTPVAEFEQQDGILGLIQTTAYGAPLPPTKRDPRSLRFLRAPRIAAQDTITAAEISGLRAFGTTSELAQVQVEVAKRQAKLNRNVQLTWENMRLGAIQGIVKDADGTDLYNLFTTFDIAQPTEVDFDLDNPAPVLGKLRTLCSQVARQIRNAAGNAWIDNRSRVVGLCDDVFWDQLIAHPEVRKTYEGYIAAAELRGDAGTGQFLFGGILFIHYDGTDGTAGSASVKVPTGKVKLFPRDTADDMWQVAIGPGESFDFINRPGQPMYSLNIPDRDRNMFTQLEVYSYPIFVNTRPATLVSGRNT